MDISLQDIYNNLHPWLGGNYVSNSVMLLTLAIVDTILGVAWRVKRGRPILSNKLKSGIIFNFGLCFIPQLVGVAFNHIHGDAPLLMFVCEILTIFISIGQLQSIMANIVLYGIQIPKWAQKPYEMFLEAEVKEKKNRDKNKED